MNNLYFIESDSFDLILPYWTGLMKSLLDALDYEDLIADKTQLQNYYLLLSKIPLLSSTNTVDDFAVSLEICKAMQEVIDEAVPELVGTALSPMGMELYSFGKNTPADDTDILSDSIENIMENAGVTQNLLSASKTANAVAQRYSVLNDSSFVFMLVSRLESNFGYYIRKNIFCKAKKGNL